MPEIWRVNLRRKRWLHKTGLFVAAAVFSYLFFINWCDWIYSCGCTFWWAGAAAHCNIQQAGPPDCPWCARTDLAGVAFLGTLATQAAIAFWPGGLGWLRALGALAASPLAAGAIGLVIGWATAYWG